MTEPDLPTDQGLVALHRRRKFVLFVAIGTALMLLLLGAVLGLWWHRQKEIEWQLQEAIADADRLDPGWRLEELEAKRAVLPDESNSALCVMKAKNLIPGTWPSRPTPAALGGLGPQANERMLDERVFDRPPEVLLEAELTQELRTELAKVGPALVEARKLVDLTDGRFPPPPGHDYLYTSLACQDARGVANLLHLEFGLRAQEGKPNEALDLCRGILNTARSVGDEPTLISQLVRISCEFLAIDSMERSLAQGEPSETALKSAQVLVEDEAAKPLLLIALRGERATINAHAEAVRAGWIKSSAFELLGRKDVQARLLEVYTQFVEFAKLPNTQQAQQLNQLATTLDNNPRTNPSIANDVVGLMTPSIGRLAEIYWRNQAILRSAQVAMAVERYRRSHGRWPDFLNDLVRAHLLREVPVDPYDDKSLRYRRLDDGVVIYSIGRDKTDNGGKVDRVNREATGTDLGFRLWDVDRRRQPVPELIPPPKEDQEP